MAANRRPRLIHLADYGGAYSGSFIPMLLAVLTAARDRGWAVELIFSEHARGRAWLEDVEQLEIPYRFLEVGPRAGVRRWISWTAAEASRGRWRGRLTHEIAEILRESDTKTILHTHFSSFDVPAAHAARAEATGVVIWHRHGGRRAGLAPLLAMAVNYRMFARSVAEIVCVAPHVAKMIENLAPARQVSFLPNAIDTDRFALTTPASRKRAREQLGLSDDEHVLLHFGWYWHLKGGDIYIDVIRVLLERGKPPNLRALTVAQDDAQESVTAAGLGSCVTVLAPAENVDDLYAAADVFVSPSRTEGMPLAVLEALATGLSVVASDIPGHEFICSSVDTCTLTRLEANDMAAAISRVFEIEPAQRLTQRAEARNWVVATMALHQWALRLMKTYEGHLATPE